MLDKSNSSQLFSDQFVSAVCLVIYMWICLCLINQTAASYFRINLFRLLAECALTRLHLPILQFASQCNPLNLFPSNLFNFSNSKNVPFSLFSFRMHLKDLNKLASQRNWLNLFPLTPATSQPSNLSKPRFADRKSSCTISVLQKKKNRQRTTYYQSTITWYAKSLSKELWVYLRVELRQKITGIDFYNMSFL